MKYLIEGKPFKSLKQIREELTFLKYKVKEGAFNYVNNCFLSVS